MDNERLYETRTDQIVALSDLLMDYVERRGNVNPTAIKRITAYRFTLALMKADDRLAPVAMKFTEVITAVERKNFKAAVRLIDEALALGYGVEA